MKTSTPATGRPGRVPDRAAHQVGGVGLGREGCRQSEEQGREQGVVSWAEDTDRAAPAHPPNGGCRRWSRDRRAVTVGHPERTDHGADCQGAGSAQAIRQPRGGGRRFIRGATGRDPRHRRSQRRRQDHHGRMPAGPQGPRRRNASRSSARIRRRGRSTIRERIGVQLQAAALQDRLRVHEAVELFASLYPRRKIRSGSSPQWGLGERTERRLRRSLRADRSSGCSSPWRW